MHEVLTLSETLFFNQKIMTSQARKKYLAFSMFWAVVSLFFDYPLRVVPVCIAIFLYYHACKKEEKDIRDL